MLIEEKRHMSTLSFSQKSSFKILHGMCETGTFEDYKYCGFHKLVFQNTSPKDGRIWYDDIEIPEEKLLEIFTLNISLCKPLAKFFNSGKIRYCSKSRIN